MYSVPEDLLFEVGRKFRQCEFSRTTHSDKKLSAKYGNIVETAVGPQDGSLYFFLGSN